MNIFTTLQYKIAAREQGARGPFAAPAKLSTTKNHTSKYVPTFFDDLSNAIWQVLTFAVIPGVILVGLWSQQTAKMQYAASSQSQYSLQCDNPESTGSNPTPTHHTPDGFGVPNPQRGEHGTQKQE